MFSKAKAKKRRRLEEEAYVRNSVTGDLIKCRLAFRRPRMAVRLGVCGDVTVAMSERAPRRASFSLSYWAERDGYGAILNENFSIHYPCNCLPFVIYSNA